MKRGDFEGASHVLFLVVVLFFLSFCAPKPDLVGKWKEVGKMATIEFSKDGTFKGVDNQGMAVSGKYALSKDGHLRCEIQEKGERREVVHLTISIKGDELTLTSPGDGEVQIYKKAIGP